MTSPVNGRSAMLRLLPSLIALLLTGCLAAGVPTPRYYVLNPTSPDGATAPSRAYPALAVRLLELRLPQYLERPQIVTRSEANELEFAEYQQWGGNLRKNLVNVLVRNLSRELGTALVSSPPQRAGIEPDFLLELEINQFEQGPGRRVTLSAWWRLMDGAGRNTLDARVTELQSTPLDARDGLDQTVRVMGETYARLCAEIAGAIRRHAAAPGPGSGRP